MGENVEEDLYVDNRGLQTTDRDRGRRGGPVVRDRDWGQVIESLQFSSAHGVGMNLPVLAFLGRLSRMVAHQGSRS